MKMRTYVLLLKIGVAIQAVVAPGLILLGMLIGNQKIKNVGIWWCGLIAIDSARTYWMNSDAIIKEYGEEILDEDL